MSTTATTRRAVLAGAASSLPAIAIALPAAGPSSFEQLCERAVLLLRELKQANDHLDDLYVELERQEEPLTAPLRFNPQRSEDARIYGMHGGLHLRTEKLPNGDVRQWVCPHSNEPDQLLSRRYGFKVFERNEALEAKLQLPEGETAGRNVFRPDHEAVARVKEIAAAITVYRAQHRAIEERIGLPAADKRCGEILAMLVPLEDEIVAAKVTSPEDLLAKTKFLSEYASPMNEDDAEHGNTALLHALMRDVLRASPAAS